MYKAKVLATTFLAFLSLHLALVLGVLVVGGGGELSLLVLFGFGYPFFANGLASAPILVIPMASAVCVFIAMLCIAPDKHCGFAIATGVAPILAFLVTAEFTAQVAMRVSHAQLVEPSCLFGVQSFTASLVDVLQNIDLFMEDGHRHKHHAHVALTGGRLMQWSYVEASFVSLEPSVFDVARIPSVCVDLFETAQPGG